MSVCTEGRLQIGRCCGKQTNKAFELENAQSGEQEWLSAESRESNYTQAELASTEYLEASLNASPKTLEVLARKQRLVGGFLTYAMLEWGEVGFTWLACTLESWKSSSLEMNPWKEIREKRVH